MTYNFGDSFDLYAVAADPINGYWDSGSGLANFTIAGRFPGSRALYFGSGNSTVPILVKSSGANDAVHHLVVAYETTTALSGSGVGNWLTFYDGATAQCTIVFRQDGAILLTSGLATGATLATYTGGVVATSTWYAFEFELVIHPTAGSFIVRKNGNSVNDFTATGLAMAPSGNAYANKLGVGAGTAVTNYLDDLFWSSSAAAGTWLGDIRCYIRTPGANVSTQFALFGTRTQSLSGAGGSGAYVYYTLYTCAYDGLLSSANITFNGSPTYTGNVKCALFNDNAGKPGTVIASASNIATNPPNGAFTFTFSPAIPVVAGQLLWLAFCPDTTALYFSLSSGSTGGWFATTSAPIYTAFPAANPNPSSLTLTGHLATSILITPTSWGLVNDVPQDGSATYVFDATVGDADVYSLASMGAYVPASVVAVTTRAYMQKSDVGTRVGTVQLKSGATTVAAPNVVLISSSWQWAWRIDVNDPSTGAPWSGAAVNAVQIGPTVVA